MLDISAITNYLRNQNRPVWKKSQLCGGELQGLCRVAHVQNCDRLLITVSKLLNALTVSILLKQNAMICQKVKIETCLQESGKHFLKLHPCLRCQSHKYLDLFVHEGFAKVTRWC